MSVRNLGYPVLALMLLLSSCKKDAVEEPVEMGYEYFPYRVGSYAVYDVDSTVWDDFNKRVNRWQYQLKETVESVFIDNQGRETFRLERAIRFADTLNWTIADVWYANRTGSAAEKVEENMRFVKLVFPVSVREKWDGHAYNEKDAQYYAYNDIYIRKQVGNVFYDSTLTVVQQKYLATLISQQEAWEVYAPGVGLVQRYDYQLSKETVDFMDTTLYHLIQFDLVEHGVIVQ